MLGCKPDFVLTSAQGGVPPTAIFTDGWIYHATAARNRVADDAEKRRNLRDAGYQVVAVTRDDVDGVTPESPGLRSEFAPFVLARAGDQLSKSAVDFVFANAVDLLLAWVQQPVPARPQPTRQLVAHPGVAQPAAARPAAPTAIPRPRCTWPPWTRN